MGHETFLSDIAVFRAGPSHQQLTIFIKKL